MGVGYRKDRKRWGYRVSRPGKVYTAYAWRTKAEATRAYHRFMAELDEAGKRPPVPKNSLEVVVSAYLADSAAVGRSKWRVDQLYFNFRKFIIPHFGATRLLEAITSEDVKGFVLEQRKRKHKGKPIANKTIAHYLTDLRALFNWAMEEERGLATHNPVTKKVRELVGSTRARKLPLDKEGIDRVARHLREAPGWTLMDQVYFDFMRFTGPRKDEANRAEWDDIFFENGKWWLWVRGTKTEDSADRLPLPAALVSALEELKKQSTSTYIFPGQSPQTRGKKMYDRRAFFRRVLKETGVKIRAKDLRDYFATLVADSTNDPNVIMRLMRHTNLQTTTRYLRTVDERLQEAVAGFGLDDSLGLQLDRKTRIQTPLSDSSASFKNEPEGQENPSESQEKKEWRWADLNCRLRGYEPRALTN